MSTPVNAGGTAGLVSSFIADVNKNDAIGNGKSSRAGGSSAGGGISGAGGGGGGGGGSWYEAMAKAWGSTMDAQASRITELSGSIGGGNDQPSSMIALTSESLRMQFISNSASTSINSVAQGIEKLASKA
ncbi:MULTISPECIES: hypothetical protein [Lysobacter]|uniref:hypothetical protein n=1 Tax=Lysobacter TaxID=68 RepID=UPI001F2016F3|nr:MULTISPECIES: hypothetical protein [Lysobacter]UJB18856.1 hypothetical protein L1A79_21460 [Lysobacter capsici]UJQ27419.1 hypothetical protein L2D09_18425 [Lysobacter gummosus]